MAVLVGCSGCRGGVSSSRASSSGNDLLALGSTVSSPDLVFDFEDELLPKGGHVCSRDLRFLSRHYKTRLEKAKKESDDSMISSIEEKLNAIDKALSRYPQVIQFSCDLQENSLTLEPFDWSEKVKVSKEISSEIVVIGAELSSLCTALSAAQRGFKVVVVYAGSLGGLSSDTGGNMRYFDWYNPTPHSKAQGDLFKIGLGMTNWTAIPTDVDKRIKKYIDADYTGKIALVKTNSYDSLHVDRQNDRLISVTTNEGVRISGKWFLDMDPESRVAEKASIPMDIDTPHLSFGMVFDVNGLSPQGWAALKSFEKIDPQALMARANVTLQQVLDNKYAKRVYDFLQKRIKGDVFKEGNYYRYGYSSLAEGYHFYMVCLGLSNPTDQLKWLNERRLVSGFNISDYKGNGTFNSISYRFKKNFLQHSHSLLKDPEFAIIRDTEIPALQEYFRYVTGDPEITVRMPYQFYVRKSTAFFQTLHPYKPSEFNYPGAATGLFTYYAMDLRDLTPRDSEGWTKVAGYVKTAKGKHIWRCRPSATFTEVSNLFLINKCAVTPAFSGGQRIEQNQINMGEALVRTFN